MANRSHETDHKLEVQNGEQNENVLIQITPALITVNNVIRFKNTEVVCGLAWSCTVYTN